ncbi:MAG TPA: site-specific integrase [Firmicutes bacterium]|nr:site-specific integrase [Bacillota bacterium]
MARVTVDGKRLTFYAKKREDAAAWLNQTLADKQRGLLVAPTKETFGHWLDVWLTEYAKPHIRPTTYADYESLIRVHLKPALENILLKDLRPEHLQKLYNDKTATGLSPRRVRLIHTVAHAALKQAVRNQLVARNVAEATTLPRQPKREIHVLSQEEQEKFLAVLDQDRLGVAFLVDLWTGLRRGELLGLKWQDIDLKKGVLRVKRSLVRVPIKKGETELRFQEPKTESGRRSIPLPPSIVSALKAHRKEQAKEKLIMGQEYQDNALVFCRSDGRPLDPSYFTYRFHQLLKKAGVNDTNFHALRHTFATRMLELGESAKVAQEILGHSNISMTLDTYSHVLPELKDAAAQKLEELYLSMQEKIASAEAKAKNH